MKAKTSGPDIAPTWKMPSRVFISPVCSACVSVMRPMVEYTAVFRRAKLMPMVAKSTGVTQNPVTAATSMLASITAIRPTSIVRLYPKRGTYEAKRNDAAAIERSLKASRVAAVVPATP